MADLLSGQIDMTFADVAIAVPQIKAGKVRALVLPSDQRSPLIPDVPTFQEAGLGQFALDAWFVLMAPTGTPADITQRLNREVDLYLKEPEVLERFRTFGFSTSGAGTPQSLQEFIRTEQARWVRIAKEVGVEPQ